MRPKSSKMSPNSKRGWSLSNILSYFLFGTCCFYAGLLTGMSSRQQGSLPLLHEQESMSQQQQNGGQNNNNDNNESNIRRTNEQLQSNNNYNCPSCPKCSPTPCPPCSPSESTNDQHQHHHHHHHASDGTKFPQSIQDIVKDSTTVNRLEFMNKFEIGVPIDDFTNRDGSQDVLLLYNHDSSIPKTTVTTLDDATSQCTTLKVILQEPKKEGHCMAIVPQWESYYVHKFMRLPLDKPNQPVDKNLPLRYVSRSHQPKGQYQKVPSLSHAKDFYPVLIDYLQHLEPALQELKPIAKAAASKDMSIIVMVCNQGQAELFHNFICTAHARNLNTDNIILFATDDYTYDLAKSLNVHVYKNKDLFGEMPTQAARAYGDRTFSKIMMAKVYCVHLIITLGYNVLFQDVDMVWYDNPLPYIEHESKQDHWDMLFQDDGAHSVRYAPYSPNTGFYFVRYNERTQFFFQMFLRMGDVIHAVSSHQAALTSLLNEHVSWKGLRVKIWNRGSSTKYPGGFEYHRKASFLKDIVQNKTDIRIFHMSWTHNKDNKKLYMEQMGHWHLQASSSCNGLQCCLKQANITCHYRDKPSSIPCPDVPPIDKGKPSFW